MDSAQALHQFWSSFGWDAVDEQISVDPKTMEELEIGDQYIAYEVVKGEFDSDVALTASLYEHSTSWDTVTKKADQIYKAIGRGGMKVNADGGQLWIKRGSPFSQRADSGNADWRRIYINITVEFQISE